MIDSPPPPAHPPGLNRLVLLSVLVAALVPAAHAWLEHRRRAPLLERRSLIEASLERAREPGQHRVPERWTERVEDRRWSWIAELPRPEVHLESLFPEPILREWRGRLGTGSSYAGLLEAPRNLAGAASRERIQLSWQPPESLPRLLAEAAGDPLLQVRYRIYRSRDGEEPRLLGSCSTEVTTWEDRELPIAREELRYSVATALEGLYGDVPTLLDSAGSELYSIDTLENYKVEVEDSETGPDGEPARARVRISAWHRGGWVDADFEVGIGEVLGSEQAVGGERVDFSTKLRLLAIQVSEDTASETVRRPEFLPDGSRKLDAAGRPTFSEQTRAVPTRTVELRCRDERGQERTFRSLPLR